MNVADTLADRRVCICGGSGGVGKTTAAAAIAMGMAAQGLRVAVVTIDPARRLANSLGLEEETGGAPVLLPFLFQADLDLEAYERLSARLEAEL